MSYPYLESRYGSPIPQDILEGSLWKKIVFLCNYR
uniref:Uncharacterized protein n=1 Tax=Staphylococcus phage 184DA TaxID=3110532 RepID=A0AAU6MXR2_9CAUD